MKLFKKLFLKFIFILFLYLIVFLIRIILLTFPSYNFNKGVTKLNLMEQLVYRTQFLLFLNAH
jgi:hypothetical protein